jgi:hypothetical protein
VTLPPAAGTVHISPRQDKAIVVPSGERVGDETSRTSSAERRPELANRRLEKKAVTRRLRRVSNILAVLSQIVSKCAKPRKGLLLL